MLYNRLSRQDQKAVEPVLETCQKMITTFSMVVTHYAKKPLLRKQIETTDADDRMDGVRVYIKQWCKDGHRVDRLTAAMTRQIGYLASCNSQNTHPQEAKFLIMQTYMLLTEIFALRLEAHT